MRVCVIAVLAALSISVSGKATYPVRLPTLKVSENRRFLVTEDGQPFFYLGDTAWELFHRLNREQAIQYLDDRASKKFNVIQAVALAELDGLDDPNAYNDLPLIARNPSQPALTPGNDFTSAEEYDYWDHVDFVIEEANRRGLYIGLLPTWGSWVPNERDKSGAHVVFNVKNASSYGRFLGQRYGTKRIIWILGGDRPANGVEPIWRAMAKGIAIGVSGKEDYSALLMTFHPGGRGTSSSTSFHDDAWLDFNMQQTGHVPVATKAGQKTTWDIIADDHRRSPAKPVIDGEPLYEDFPIGFRAAKEHGYSSEAHVRQRAYWHVFSGACGHTYGNNSVWQMYSPGKKPIQGPLFYWHEAIHRPGSAQMQHLRALIESRPFLTRVPDQSLVADTLSGPDHVAATRGDDYAFVYSAQGRPFTVNLGKISGQRLVAWWFNPRNGAAEKIGFLENTGTCEFVPHIHGGFGTDYVLVLDDEARRFPAPGSYPERNGTR